MKRLIHGAAVASLVLAGGVSSALAGATFDAVKERGELICGVHTGLPGFAAPDDKGVWKGLDADMCRVVAAAVFGDPNKVKFVPLTAQQRFTALQSGEIDMLSRNTTDTLSRDTALGLNFTVTTYYDGQGFLVPKKLGVKSALELGGATVCVQTGTTTELNLADYFRANKMELHSLTIEAYEEVTAAFLAGRCDVLTSDSSQLATIRANDTSNPADYVILPEIISKEPLAPAVRHGDDEWYDVVKWSIYATIEAEEKGVSSKNVDQAKGSADPTVKRLLGITPGLGKDLGLDEEWAYNIIKQVGNYGEIYERTVGMDSKLQLPRGLNAQWTKGGLMYSPPFR